MDVGLRPQLLHQVGVGVQLVIVGGVGLGRLDLEGLGPEAQHQLLAGVAGQALA